MFTFLLLMPAAKLCRDSLAMVQAVRMTSILQLRPPFETPSPERARGLAVVTRVCVPSFVTFNLMAHQIDRVDHIEFTVSPHFLLPRMTTRLRSNLTLPSNGLPTRIRLPPLNTCRSPASGLPDPLRWPEEISGSHGVHLEFGVYGRRAVYRNLDQHEFAPADFTREDDRLIREPQLFQLNSNPTSNHLAQPQFNPTLPTTGQSGMRT
jgi:hypothetical protein